MNEFTREALILAGGLGTRLRSVVSDRPKPIADVAGRPFLEHLLEQLVRYGYRRAVLCVGHRAEQIEARLGTSFGPLTLAYSREHAPLGTGGALALAAELAHGPEVLAMNGDSFCDMDFNAFAAAHHNAAAAVSLAVLYQADRSRAGSVELDASGRITMFSPRPVISTPGFINAGVYMFRTDVLRAISKHNKVSLEEEIFPSMAERGELFGWHVRSEFIDIGTPASYEAAQGFFLKN